MIRSKTFDPKTLLRGASALVVAAAIAFALTPNADAQRGGGNQEEEEEQANRQLSNRVGEIVLEANEANDAENFQAVIDAMNRLLGTDMSAYEQSIVYRLRGNARFQLENYQGAIDDFLAAINTGALVTDETVALRTNLGQLYIVTEQYQQGIEQFQLAIEAGATLNARLAKTLAQAYIQAAQNSSGSTATQYIRDGLEYAELFYNETADKTEGDFALLQFYYMELERPRDELRVVRESLSAFPGSRRNWQNLVSLYARLDEEQNAFEANKLMYLNGLFEDEEELFRLVQYYSFYDNPYRGATLLEREMNAGRIPTNERYLESLANMWRQAAEFDRAIPVLERLSQMLGDGETALRLAEAHFQLNDPAAAEGALETAIERGGLSDTGKAYELLGNARFDQDKLQEALQAFNQAARYPSSRSAANGWIRFINSQIEGERRRARQREEVVIEECRLTLDAERRQAVLLGEVDEEGRVRLPEEALSDRCAVYFDIFGDQIREAGEGEAQAASEAEGETEDETAEG